MFSFTGKIRYSETDKDGFLSNNALLNYFQDCAVFHSDSAGLSGEELRRRGMAWVVSSWQIIWNCRPKRGEDVRCITNPYLLKGFFGHRNFSLETAEGETLAVANSLWTLINPETGAPVRVGEDFAEKYVVGEPFEMPYAKRKIPMPDVPVRRGEAVPVHRHMLDSNGHMNNSRYVVLAEDCLPQGDGQPMDFRQLRIEYKKSAHEGDILYPAAAVTEDAVTVVLEDADGKSYATIEFAKEPRV